MSGQEEDKKAVTPCSYDKDQASIYRINIFISGAQNGLAWLYSETKAWQKTSPKYYILTNINE